MGRRRNYKGNYKILREKWKRKQYIKIYGFHESNTYQQLHLKIKRNPKQPNQEPAKEELAKFKDNRKKEMITEQKKIKNRKQQKKNQQAEELILKRWMNLIKLQLD